MNRVAERVHRKSLLSKFVSDPSDLLPYFKDGQYLGWSGFTGVGYPKIMPTLLADHVEKNNLQGKMRFGLFVGASTGAETEDRWAKLNMIERRIPYQLGKNIQDGINSGRIRFADTHLSKFPQDLINGYYTLGRPSDKLDVVFVEATEVLEDGSIVLGASVGSTPALIQQADKIVIEVNTFLHSFKGLHDLVHMDSPPNRKPLLINRCDDRIGSFSLPIDHEKVLAVIESRMPDNTTSNDPQDENSKAIAQHILHFFEEEVNHGRLPPSLLPLQSGIGNISNAIVGGMASGPFKDVTVWTEVLQDTFLDFFDEGKLKFASATSIRLSQEGFQRFYSHWNNYCDKIILRPQNISNSPEIINRLGVIAMNTPVEFDIYGHANSTNVNGSRMINGLGGSADFLRNSRLSIMHTPSTRPTKNDPNGISCVVPMCSHVDQTEHDVAVYVTEQGYADLRGLSPKERARKIIQNCVHPEYKDQLLDYYNTAEQICLKKKMGHIPHTLHNVFKMHTNLMENGTMKLKSWN